MEGDPITNALGWLVTLLCLGAPMVVNAAFAALLVWGAVWWSKRGAPRTGGKVRQAPAQKETKNGQGDILGGAGDRAEATRRYASWAPTREHLLEWRERLVVARLGDEREVQLKTLLDRALSEDLFNRFGDTFVVLMKVNCFHVVRPGGNAPMEVWNAVFKRHVDFLICDRSTLEPAMAIMIWLGEGEPPGIAGGMDASAAVERMLNEREWEQWIAQGLLLAGGIPALMLSREWADASLSRPELMIEAIAPVLAAHRDDLAALGRATE